MRAGYSSYDQLIKMLDQGWRIEAPVYSRPRFRSPLRSKEESTVHFILWRENRVNLVSVLNCQEVEDFLVRSDLTIDRL